jgi:hypothetical protein
VAALNVQSFKYEATWVAANFKITPPTPETHPKFPLWELGYTPEEVYKEFWPSGFQYVSSKVAFLWNEFDFRVSATIPKDQQLAADLVPNLQNSGGNGCVISRHRG